MSHWGKLCWIHKYVQCVLCFFLSASNKLRSLCQSVALNLTLPQNIQSLLPEKSGCARLDIFARVNSGAKMRRKEAEAWKACGNLDRVVLENWKQAMAEVQELWLRTDFQSLYSVPEQVCSRSSLRTHWYEVPQSTKFQSYCCSLWCCRWWRPTWWPSIVTGSWLMRWVQRIWIILLAVCFDLDKDTGPELCVLCLKENAIVMMEFFISHIILSSTTCKGRNTFSLLSK